MKSLFARLPIRGADMTLTLVMVAGFVVLSISSDGAIFSHNRIVNFLTYLSIPILIGLAQMCVLAIGQLNLAVGAMGGAITGLMAVMMQDWGLPVWVSLLVGVLAGAALGALNGILVVITQLHGFIITLGTMTILLGVQYALVRSFTIADYSDTLKSFGDQNLIGIPYLFMATIVVSILLFLFFDRSVVGRRLLATGGSDAAARLSGISNGRSTVVAFTVSGLVTGIAAVMTIASLTGINTSIGGDWLLPSFAAPIIGGVLLTGGSVAVYGTIVAAVVLRIVDVARAQFLLDPSWTNFVIGAVVLSTVAVSEYRKRRTASVMERREAVTG